VGFCIYGFVAQALLADDQPPHQIAINMLRAAICSGERLETKGTAMACTKCGQTKQFSPIFARKAGTTPRRARQNALPVTYSPFQHGGRVAAPVVNKVNIIDDEFFDTETDAG
jgi:hypothetical protein